MYYLSIGSVIKDEQKYLKEWIDYHLLLGVTHFYLLDNSNHNECYKVLKPYIADGLIDYKKYPEKELPQLHGFSKLIHDTRKETKWLALIDPDEFIFLKGKDFYNLNKFLELYDQYAGLAIHWLCFGSSGRKNTEPATINLYQRSEEKADINLKIKCIVQPTLTAEAGGSHYFRYIGNNFAVNENYEKMPSGLNGHKSWKPTKHTSNLIRINHYPLRSRQALLEKIERGFVDMGTKPNPIDWKRYWQEFNQNKVFDDSMKPWFKKIDYAVNS